MSRIEITMEKARDIMDATGDLRCNTCPLGPKCEAIVMGVHCMDVVRKAARMVYGQDKKNDLRGETAHKLLLKILNEENLYKKATITRQIVDALDALGDELSGSPR